MQGLPHLQHLGPYILNWERRTEVFLSMRVIYIESNPGSLPHVSSAALMNVYIPLPLPPHFLAKGLKRSWEGLAFEFPSELLLIVLVWDLRIEQ